MWKSKLHNSTELHLCPKDAKTGKSDKVMPVNPVKLCRHANKWNQESKSLLWKNWRKKEGRKEGKKEGKKERKKEGKTKDIRQRCWVSKRESKRKRERKRERERIEVEELVKRQSHHVL
jgi:hypothetical protein